MRHDPISWLYGLQSHGVKLGLDGIRSLLRLLGHPERDLQVILVGGTNGKGSTAAMVDAILGAHGIRSGLYTSPHLVHPVERIRIAGEPIAPARLDDGLRRIASICADGVADGSLSSHPSFFEVITASALVAFREAGLRVAVLEVGLGGRLDATNATEPIVSAIVTVDLDHVATLGATLAEIAREKAGIARRGRPLVSGVSSPEALAVLRERCAELGAELIDAREAVLPPGVKLALDGAHQRDNARVAVAVCETAARVADLPCDPLAIRLGLETARWPGRLQTLPGAPAILLDGAHNPAGAAALAAHLAVRGGTKPILLFAAMSDKDVRGILAPLAPHVAGVVATRPDLARAAEAEELAVAARALGLPAWPEPSSSKALDRARSLAGPGGVVLVAGSLYLIGEILGALQEAPAPGPVPL